MREFFSYSEMSKDDFRALQLVELDMLVYFDLFCKEHDLRYYIAGGTLIGAVRNKGFIPWDEDIDLHMPRPDYNRLPDLWNNYADTEHYTLCVTTREKNFRHNVYAISDNHTTLVEERTINDDIPQGIRMDILPFDGVPDNRFAAGLQFFWAIIFSIYNVQRLPENQGGILMRCVVALMLKIVPDQDRRYMIWKYAEKQISKYSFDNSPWVRELAAPLKSMRFKYPRDHFDSPVFLEFEGLNVPAQHYYQDYLNNVYPNYMELPPENKRVQKTRAIYINLDEGYRTFRGKYYCINLEKTGILYEKH